MASGRRTSLRVIALGEKIDVENVDALGFPITCGHLDDREKFGNIPLEHSADMAVCKECYIRLTPAPIVEEMDIEVPDGVVPGELVKTLGGTTAGNSETEGDTE